jgi:hypothetical protein
MFTAPVTFRSYPSPSPPPANAPRTQSGGDRFVRFGKGTPPIPEPLRLNRQEKFITPSHVQYLHQWLWDAAFHAIILSRYDMAMAKSELSTLMEAQWPNGFVPHTHFNPKVTGAYRPNADDWATGRPTSGITQPPLIATALKEVYAKSGDLDFVRRLYPAVMQFHEWLKADRDDDGLLFNTHPWESGTDNSPLWDGMRDRLLKTRYGDEPVPPRADTQRVNAEHRPKEEDYKVYWGLIREFTRLNWDQREIAQKSPFKVAEPLFNSIWVQANADLADLADALGKPQDARKLRAWATETRQAMNDRLWDQRDAFYYPRDLVTGQPVKIKTIHGLLPLYAGVPDQQRAGELVRRHFLNPAEFYAPAGVPSTALDEKTFDARRYWRGPVWINTQWLMIQGLQKYGFTPLATELAIKTQNLVKNQGYFEYYHPLTGQGLGAPHFSWSALADIL